jgi:hypothetical protein
MCFITYLIGHIIVNFFNDLQVRFEYIIHAKENFFLNISVDEVILILFYNKNNDSLIILSIYVFATLIPSSIEPHPCKKS